MGRRIFGGAALTVLALAAGLAGLEQMAAAQDQRSGPALPAFEVDPNFPTLPDQMLLGGVGGATADSHGNVWVIHRPHTLEEGNATVNGYLPAPPVVQFSASGQYIQGWGGPTKAASINGSIAAGCFRRLSSARRARPSVAVNGDGRPGSGEHGIAVDAQDNVWLTGNGDGDGQVLKFTKDGKFLLRIGKDDVGRQ